MAAKVLVGVLGTGLRGGRVCQQGGKPGADRINAGIGQEDRVVLPGQQLSQLHKCKDGLTSAGEWTAHYSQCDLNGHLNNAFYLDLVCDALPLEVMRKGPVTFASINYHREIPMGETAEVFYAPSADGWYVVGKHNGQTSFECYLEVGKTNV